MISSINTDLLIGLVVLLTLNILLAYKLWGSQRNEHSPLDESFLTSFNGEAVIIDSDDSVSFTTSSFEDLLGFPDDLVGQDAAEVLPMGDQLIELASGNVSSESLFENDQPLTDGGSTQSATYDLPALRPHSTGLELVLMVNDEQKHFVIRPGSLDQFPVDRRFLIFEDITESRQSEVRLRSIIEQVSDFVAVVCSSGKIQSFKSSKFTQPDDGGAVLNQGDLIYESIHPDEKQEFIDTVESVIKNDQPVEKRFRVNLFTGKWLLFNISIRNSDSLLCGDGVVIIGEDINKEHQYKQRRQVLSRVLRHNLRNDMNVICGHARLLIDSENEIETNHSEVIFAKANSLMTLAEKVREIDQQLYGSNRQLRRINVAQIVREEIESLHKKVDKVEFSHCLDETPIIANSLVRVAIKNLLENSVEHNDNEMPKIKVETVNEPEKHRVSVHISDNGPGIPKGEYRALVEGSETKLDHVSGVGLWLVKWIVDGVDGSITIADNEPRGTTVSITFPSAESSHVVDALMSRSNATSTLEEQIHTSMNGGTIHTTTRSGD